LKKIIVFFALTVLWAALAPADVSPKIFDITIEPVPDGLVYKNTPLHIRWQHSAYYSSPGQTCRIFCGEFIISPKVPVINRDFVWKGGRKHDGTYIPLGEYTITIESLDYDALSGPKFHYVKELPKFTIITPPDGKKLKIGTTQTIRWTHSAYFDVFPQRLYLTLTPIIGEGYIAEAQVTDDKYVWQVGRMRDGIIVPPGNYRISAECSDYWGCNDVNVKLKAGSGGD